MQTQLKRIPSIEPGDYPMNVINLREALGNIHTVVGELVEEQERQSSLNGGMAKSLQECKTNFEGINVNFQTLFEFVEKQKERSESVNEEPSRFAVGEEYYWIEIDADGASVESCGWENDEVDRLRAAKGVLFSTESEADMALGEVLSFLGRYK